MYVARRYCLDVMGKRFYFFLNKSRLLGITLFFFSSSSEREQLTAVSTSAAFPVLHSYLFKKYSKPVSHTLDFLHRLLKMPLPTPYSQKAIRVAKPLEFPTLLQQTHRQLQIENLAAVSFLPHNRSSTKPESYSRETSMQTRQKGGSGAC